MVVRSLELACEEEIEDQIFADEGQHQVYKQEDCTELSELSSPLTYRCMLRQELQGPDYSKHYDYLKYRRVLVDWMSEVGEEMHIRKSTVHTAIAYLERVLIDGPLPPKERFQLLALSCLLIAAKYNGPECEVPPMSEFWEFGNRCYSIAEIHTMELSTLSKLDWNLTALGPIHFVEYFTSRRIIFPDDTIEDTFVNGDASDYYKKYIEFFMEICLQEYQFQCYRPSLVASSILAVCRKALGISPAWREELEELTGYLELQVEPCYCAIWSHYTTTFGDKLASEEVSPTSISDVASRRL